MQTDFSCGVVPVYVRDGVRQFLLIQHLAGHWAFPKGHPEAGETDLAAATRELAEETGITQVGVRAEPAFDESYVFIRKDGKKVRKTVRFFIGHVEDPAVVLQAQEVGAYAWGDLAQTRERMTFAAGLGLLDAVEAHLAGANPTDRA